MVCACHWLHSVPSALPLLAGRLSGRGHGRRMVGVVWGGCGHRLEGGGGGGLPRASRESPLVVGLVGGE